MSPQEQAHTRERLVVAARDLFHQQGYNATGIAQILRQAGANAGSLYYFFPTKEDLLRAVLEWYRDHIHEALLDPIWTNVSDPVERVFALLNGYRAWLIETEFVYGCPIGNLALELSATHPAVRDLIAKNFSNWKDAVKECFEDARGKLPEVIDCAALASFALTVMEGGVMQARAYQRIEPFDTAVSQLRDYVERLIDDGTKWGGNGEMMRQGGSAIERFAGELHCEREKNAVAKKSKGHG